MCWLEALQQPHTITMMAAISRDEQQIKDGQGIIENGMSKGVRRGAGRS